MIKYKKLMIKVKCFQLLWKDKRYSKKNLLGFFILFIFVLFYIDLLIFRNNFYEKVI